MGLLTAVLWSVATGPALAAPDATSVRERDDDGRIVARWGGPTVHVDWTGAPYKTVQASFVGDRVATPGDDVHRTLRIGNAGPSEAVMAISFDLSRLVPALARNPDLADHIEIYWSAAGVRGKESFATLLGRNAGQPVVAEVRVPRDSTVPVTAGFRMAADTTAGRSNGRDSTVLSFDVLVRMSGDTDEAGLLPETGSPRGLLGLAVAGVLLFLVGLAVLPRRGRRCDWCTQHVLPEEGSVHIGRGRSKEFFCLRCAPGRPHLVLPS